jgi:hypothetical protein
VVIIVEAALWGQPKSDIRPVKRERLLLQLCSVSAVVIVAGPCRPFAKLAWIAKNSS